MKHYIFSYGTLQKEEIQLKLFHRILKGAADILRGYKTTVIEIKDEAFLLSNEKYQRMAIRTDDISDTISGTVFEITEEELLSGDAYEPAEYKRIQVLLDSGKEVWIYVPA